jgi:hypothetical protein
LHHIDRAFSQRDLHQLTLINKQVQVSIEKNALIVGLSAQPELQKKLNKEVEKKASIG